MKKRGMSQVVTVVIFIVLALVLALIVWNIISKIIQENTELIETGFDRIDLDIKKVSVQENKIKIVVERNSGQGDLYGIRFIISNSTSSTIIDSNTSLDELERKVFEMDYEGDFSEISISPILQTKSKKEIIGNIVSKYKYKESTSSSSCTPNCPLPAEVDCGTTNTSSDGCGGTCDVTGTKCAEGVCIEGECFSFSEIQSLEAYYEFNGSYSDYSGNNYDATAYSTTFVEDRHNKLNNAIYFNGVDASINLPSSSSTMIAKPIGTVEIWFKPEEIINKNFIYFNADSRDTALYIEDNYLYAGLYVNTLSDFAYIKADTPINAEQYYHVCFSYNVQQSHLKLYLNGELKNETDLADQTSPGYDTHVIGYDADHNDFYFNGTIDELRLYSEMLSDSNISALYQLN